LWYDTFFQRLFVRIGTGWIDASPVDGVGISSTNELVNGVHTLSLGADGRTTFPVATVPAHSYGVVGDKAGMLAFDASYIYYCFADYNGLVTISNVSTQPGGVANGYFFNIANAALSEVRVGWTITGPNIVGSANITQITYSSVNEWEFQTDAGSVDLRNQSGYTLSGYPDIWKRTAHGAGTW